MQNQAGPARPRAKEIGSRPTPEQELLLRASLLEGTDVLEAWKEWEHRVDLDLLDAGSRQLLPLLYRNLLAHGATSLWMEKLKGMYRMAWYKNQRLLGRLTAVLQAFQASGIRTLLHGGAALIPLHYRDFGLRPMEGADVLVPAEHALQAVELLTTLGFRPMRIRRRAFQERLLSAVHAEPFVDSDEHRLALHWHLLPEGCYEGADLDFWEAAVTLDLQGLMTLGLSPTDELFSVCVEGVRWNPLAPFRWIADAMVILQRTEEAIDWQRLIAQAQKRGLVLQVRRALGYLRQALDAPIPPEVIHRMDEMPVSKIEEMEWRVKSRPPGLAGDLPFYWFLFLRSSKPDRDSALRARYLGFPAFLQQVWGLDSLWQVPLHALVKGTRRMWRRAVGGRG